MLVPTLAQHMHARRHACGEEIGKRDGRCLPLSPQTIWSKAESGTPALQFVRLGVARVGRKYSLSELAVSVPEALAQWRESENCRPKRDLKDHQGRLSVERRNPPLEYA